MATKENFTAGRVAGYQCESGKEQAIYRDAKTPGLALRAGEKLPLLVMLHGCGQTGRELAASSRMNRLAVRHRFLVLYPEQERLANAHRVQLISLNGQFAVPTAQAFSRD